MTHTKPPCKLTGTDGNVYAIIHHVSRALEKAGQRERAAEFRRRAMSGDFTYDQILGVLVHEYVAVS
jgi:hypothetical protein